MENQAILKDAILKRSAHNSCWRVTEVVYLPSGGVGVWLLEPMDLASERDQYEVICG